MVGNDGGSRQCWVLRGDWLFPVSFWVKLAGFRS
uniref:Uncharacterized protein n=1 Tax=Picea sitchensis TaxID=3332 RepID=A9NY82_PICSI|nr:unknown [Picea sitchensis]